MANVKKRNRKGSGRADGRRRSASRTRPRARARAAAALPGGGRLLLVNMIPRSLSDETEQDSEPSLAVNPKNVDQIVGTAFTPDPLRGNFAPVFLSTDGGNTWRLNSIVPSQTITQDIYVGFGPSGQLYAGVLTLPAPVDIDMNIVSTPDAQSTAPMRVLSSRVGVDQPFVQAGLF